VSRARLHGVNQHVPYAFERIVIKTISVKRRKKSDLGNSVAVATPPSVMIQQITIARPINARQLASFFSISPATVRRLVGQGDLPHMRIGGQIRFDLGEVAKAITKKRS
jgi:excisionase family DNA binding protein